MHKIIFFILLSFSLSAQHYVDTVSSKRLYFSKNEFPTNERTIAQFLEQKIDHLNSPNSKLILLYNKESLGGKHFCFTQSIFNIPVYRSMVKVNILNNTEMVEVYDLSFSEKDVVLPLLHADYLFPQENKLISVTKKNEDHFFIFQDANDQAVYTFDKYSYSGKKDTTAMLTVFNPDPLTSAQVSYGTPYYDNNDATNASLDAQMQWKSVALKFQNDTFFLENDYYFLKDFDSPTIPVVTSIIDTFQYNRSQSGFEDINAFYHLSVAHDYIASLGFSNLVNHQLYIDSHAWSGAENSSFDEYTIPASLLFGEGGIDDAEDADVVVHEFGHFVSANAAPASNTGLQRNAIDEGFGDYLASSYSKNISTYNWSKVFNWDGNNGSWQGRNSASTKLFPANYSGNKWKDGEMWSSVLMEINGDLGRGITDSLVLQALYAQSTNTTMTDAALQLLGADSALFNAKHHCILYQRLSDRGLLPADSCTTPSVSEITLTGSYNFLLGGNLLIQLPNYSTGDIYLYDVNGKLIDHATFSNKKSFNYAIDNLSSGLYIIDVRTNNANKMMKIVRE